MQWALIWRKHIWAGRTYRLRGRGLAADGRGCDGDAAPRDAACRQPPELSTTSRSDQSMRSVGQTAAVLECTENGQQIEVGGGGETLRRLLRCTYTGVHEKQPSGKVKHRLLWSPTVS